MYALIREMHLSLHETDNWNNGNSSLLKPREPVEEPLEQLIRCNKTFLVVDNYYYLCYKYLSPRNCPKIPSFTII